MKSSLQPSESVLLAACAALLALAVFGPSLAQPASQHAFADHSTWLGIPHAMDVLSNLPFLAWGLAGLIAVKRIPALAVSGAQRATAALFFAGLLVTAAASSWYHLRPDDAGLLLDRGGMALAFAGLLGLAVADRISGRAGLAVAGGVLVLGPVSAGVWAATGNVLPWAVVQFGGMLLVCVLALRRPADGALGLRLGMVIGIYALAKLLELADHQVLEATSGIVSGHSLKHIAAAFAAWPVMNALERMRRARHNAIQTGRAVREAGRIAQPARHA